tara:strand:- start:20 stop:619 length:600 start_codon:yes stop_codon:yes gene_type:complete
MFKELIWVKKDSLSESFCKGMIEKFDIDPNRDEGKVDQNNPRVDKSLKVTMDMGITWQPEWAEEDKILCDALDKALYEYEGHLYDLSNNGLYRLHPSYGYEIKDTGYKIQKYAPNGYYHWHHDWCMHKGWSRTFTYIWYLNTISEKDGGWTEFIDGTRIQPECGSILFFPATWTYVHRGSETKVPKYIVNGWIYGRPRS